MLGNLFREKTDENAIPDSITKALESMQDIVSRSSEAMNAVVANYVPPQANNIHLFEIAKQNPHHDISQELQGNFHEIYFEWVKNRSEIYSCIDSACSDLVFGSLVDVVTHEERAHGKISYGGYLCNVSGCQHSFPGNGFYGKAILMNHMKTAHKQVEQDSSAPSEEQVHMPTDTGTITKVLSKIKSFTEDFMNPSMDSMANSRLEAKATGEASPSQAMIESIPVAPSNKMISATKKGLPVGNLTAPVDILFSHTEYQSHKVVPFITVRQLGHGSLGVVDAVRMESPESGSILLARKIIRVRTIDRKRLLPIIQQEIDVLRRLKHKHIIQIVGTYETTCIPRQFGILIHPAGDEDLHNFLERAGENDFPEKDIGLLRDWQYCLTSAVAYIHQENIRHKDIKPSNIICKNDQVFLADFGSARQFSTGLTSTTEGYAAGITKMYSAPEVLEEEPRGRPADIYSLGCVFAEMAAVANSRRIEEFHEYRSEPDPDDPERMTLLYSVTSHKLGSWFTELGDTWTSSLLDDMLRSDPKSRPAAKDLLLTIAMHSGISKCCSENRDVS
jgi:tRNA A-37 threonylcarbamoyl transferase component Bud32